MRPLRAARVDRLKCYIVTSSVKSIRGGSHAAAYRQSDVGVGPDRRGDASRRPDRAAARPARRSVTRHHRHGDAARRGAQLDPAQPRRHVLRLQPTHHRRTSRRARMRPSTRCCCARPAWCRTVSARSMCAATTATCSTGSTACSCPRACRCSTTSWRRATPTRCRCSPARCRRSTACTRRASSTSR